MLNLKYFKKYPNIGDQLSVKLCCKYFTENISEFQNEVLNVPNLMLIGSILEWADEMSYVCGAGLIQSSGLVRFAPKHIYCVRGPLTAYYIEKQGVGKVGKYGDPGLLIKKLYNDSVKTRYKVGIVAHYVDQKLMDDLNISASEISIINVFLTPQEFAIKIQECEVIFSSSLHGLVTAHAYEIPALWVEFSDNVIGGGFKFYDYYLGVGVSPEHVKKVRVSGETDFLEISKLATVVDIEEPVAMLEEAFSECRSQIFY